MFSRGQIVRIKCENVLTYNNIEIYPCPKLNLVVGANGTGKSTIICAIILGLGGNAAVVGRATELKQYIKLGQKTALIEIELYDPAGNNVIQRRFNMNGESRFAVNGRIVSLEKVEKYVRHFQIQIDNLCQILPQEKLEQFAKMNDHERLVGTLLTVGNTKLSKWLEQLKMSKETEAHLRRKLVLLRNELTESLTKKDGMENVVKAVREKTFLIECLKLLKQRRAWQFYFHMKQTLTMIDDGIKNKQASYQRMTAVLKNTMAEVQASSTQLCNVKEASKKTETKLLGLVQNVKKKQNEIAVTTEKISDIKTAFKQKQAKAKSQESDVKSLTLKIDKLKSDMANADQLGDDIENLNARISRQEKDVRELAHAKERISLDVRPLKNQLVAYQSKLGKIDSVYENKMRLLKRNYEDSCRGVHWLDENMNLFRGEVYGPMFLHLNVNDAKNAKYVENCVANRDLFAFICELREDTSTLIKELREKRKLKISVVTAHSNVSQDDLTPPYSIDSLRQFGFHSFVSDYISGPQIIVEYLTLTYRLHSIPVGTSRTDQMTDKVPATIRTYFTDRYRFSTRIASLTGQKIESSNEISDSRFLTASADAGEAEELKRKYDACELEYKTLQEKFEEMEEKVKSGDAVIKQLRNELNKLRDKKTMQHRLQETLKSKMRELNQMQNSVVDLSLEKHKCNIEVKVTLAKVCNMYIELSNSLKGLFESYIQFRQDKINIDQAERVHRKNLQVSSEFVKTLKKEAGSLRKLDWKKKRLAKYTNAIHEWALKCTGRKDPRSRAFERQKTFFKLTDNVVVLSKLIVKFQAKINCLGGANDGLQIFMEYKSLVKEIAYLEKKIQKKEDILKTHFDKLDETKTNFLREVQLLIETIDRNFQKFFEMMECAGTICLYQGEEEEAEDFNKYGIHIKVKFRQQGELQILNSQIQSGGERAVSIAIYLLSLQELTTVPFRCIDEINQGMDAINERKIFNLITKATEERGNTQYFLLTPKLLPNLNFTANSRIFFPYNGVGSLPHKKFLEYVKKRQSM